MNLYLISYNTKTKIMGQSVIKTNKTFEWLDFVTFEYIRQFETNAEKVLKESYKNDKDMIIESVDVIAVSKLDDTE